MYLFSPVGFKGNLSLLDIVFPGVFPKWKDRSWFFDPLVHGHEPESSPSGRPSVAAGAARRNLDPRELQAN